MTAVAQQWYSLSNASLTSTAVTDVGITALLQLCHLLPDVWLTNTAVTDEGITVFDSCWHSLSNALVTNSAVTDEGITALVQYSLSLSNFVLTNIDVMRASRQGFNASLVAQRLVDQCRGHRGGRHSRSSASVLVVQRPFGHHSGHG